MGDWRLMFLHRDRLKAVTPDDVLRVAKAYLRPENRTVGTFTPTKEAQRAQIPQAPDVAALVKDSDLGAFAGRVSDSGEGRWTIKAAIDEAVPVPVLSTALYQRFSSRGESDFQDKLLSAMRYEFGGHVEKEAGS